MVVEVGVAVEVVMVAVVGVVVVIFGDVVKKLLFLNLGLRI